MALRVLFVAPWGERLGGAEEMLWSLLRYRDPRRLEPELAFLGGGPFVAEVAGLGIETGVIESGRLRDPVATLRVVRRLAVRMRRSRPDLIVNWSAKTQIYGAPAALAAGMGRRIVWWQHAVPDGHWVDRLATLMPARAIGCSSGANQAGQNALRPYRQTFVLAPGVDASGGGAADSRQLRRGLRIPRERLVVGIVGRLQPWKGQDRFLRALAALRAGGTNVHGLLVGGDAYGLSPEYAADLERLVGELELDEFVTMTGQVEDPLPYYRLMDVCVNASQPEPFGIVLLEAMAAGVPVVAVDSGGPREIVEQGVTGVLVESGRPGHLAEGIRSLVCDDEARAAMGEAAQGACEDRFSARKAAALLADRLAEFADG